MTQTLIHPDEAVEQHPTVARVDTVACPECGRQAVVEWRANVGSTDGALEHLKIRCPGRHWFLMPSALLAS